MKLKKLLALALAGVLMLALLTGCSGGGNGEDRLVAEAVADIFKGNSQNVEVSYGVPALTRTIRPAFTPDWFQNTPEGIIWLDGNFPHRRRSDAGKLPERQPESLRAEQFRELCCFRLHRDERPSAGRAVLQRCAGGQGVL